MIYLHRYRIASGHSYKDRVTVYDDLEKALGQCRVIGGSIQAYAAVEDLEAKEQAKEVLLDEVERITGYQVDKVDVIVEKLVKAESGNEKEA